jgi:hypothetical protein
MTGTDPWEYERGSEFLKSYGEGLSPEGAALLVFLEGHTLDLVGQITRLRYAHIPVVGIGVPETPSAEGCQYLGIPVHSVSGITKPHVMI